jgi:hypothetical protein
MGVPTRFYRNPYLLSFGAAMFGFPDGASETLQEFDRQILKTAEDPLFPIPKQPDTKLTQRAVQDCLDYRKSRSGTSQ